MKKRISVSLVAAALFSLAAIGLGPAPLAAEESGGKPRVAVFGLMNLTGDASFNIPAETANESLALILKMLRIYDVVTVDSLPRDLSESGLAEWCLANGANYFLYGTVLPAAGGRQEYRVAVYDNLKRKISIRKSERGESVLDVFSVCDSLTGSVAEALVGHSIAFGSLEFANVGEIETFTAWIDGTRLSDNSSGVDRVVAGPHTVKITQAMYGRDVDVLEKEVTVAEGKSTRVEFKLEKIRDAGLPLVVAAGGVVIPPYVRIEGGYFQMGDDRIYDSFDVGGNDYIAHARPVHQVTLNAYMIGTTEVTQAQYEKVVGTNPSAFKGENLPVEGVSWVEACIYCNRLSLLEGYDPAYVIIDGEVTWDPSANGWRLPTDAEWENACKAGKNEYYLNGFVLTKEEANFDFGHCYNPEVKKRKDRIYTLPVASFKPNAFGLYDTFGNVPEWCWDWFGPYDEKTQNNPSGPRAGKYRVTRGGGWDSRPETIKSVNRNPVHPSNGAGFRVARNAK